MLAQWLPVWSSFQIHAVARDLGLQLGAKAKSVEWKALLTKLRDRLLLIVQAGAPPQISLPAVDMYANSVLQYWAQMLPPRELTAREVMTSLCRVLHVPPGSVTRGFFARLPELGVKSCRIPI